jgi:uncharacterized membrane protein YcaP (DUF421 family)
MRDTLIKIFGEGKDLGVGNMCARAFVIFILAWLFIRISGRRSFGLKRPLDNIIVVLLGSVLGRAITGSSPFIPTVAGCLVIVVMHRLLSLISIYNRTFSAIVNGKKILLFKDGVFNKRNMVRSLVHEEDVQEQVRLKALTDSMDKIEAVHMEKNGEISSIKKA